MDLRSHLLQGHVIPALPLALDVNRKHDERSQRALARYYLHAGAGGLAVGVHSTQFEIRDPKHGLFKPVLELTVQTLRKELEVSARNFALIAGICGRTAQASAEATLAVSLGYHAGLLSLAAMNDESEDAVLRHAREIASVIPIIGFYLQPAVGGRVYSCKFWREFAKIPGLVAIKIAPFNRYQTLDVVRAVTDAGRSDVALYTGNDDNIIPDLLTPFRFSSDPGMPARHIAGGLLGQWGVGTHAAVRMLEELKRDRASDERWGEWLERGVALTDINAAVFDSANGFAGVIPGILEVLRRDGLVGSNLCLDESLELSAGQSEELARVRMSYPEFWDDEFIRENKDSWLRQ